jgi:hypothetical protein
MKLLNYVSFYIVVLLGCESNSNEVIGGLEMGQEINDKILQEKLGPRMDLEYTSKGPRELIFVGGTPYKYTFKNGIVGYAYVYYLNGKLGSITIWIGDVKIHENWAGSSETKKLCTINQNPTNEAVEFVKTALVQKYGLPSDSSSSMNYRLLEPGLKLYTWENDVTEISLIYNLEKRNRFELTYTLNKVERNRIESQDEKTNVQEQAKDL